MKKLIILILFTLSSITYGQLSQINVGTSANDGTGESIRSAFQKVNLGITQINTNTDSLKLKLNKVDTLTLSNRINAKLDITSAISYPGSGIPLSTGSAWGTSITNNSSNWNTAYSDRLKWDGGSTGLTAATGRTSLGGTTAGQALFTLTNPSAITFLRINADNTVTALSAANFKTALSLTATDVGLGNVTNESKATMFTNPTFTGVVTIPEGFYLGGSSVEPSAAELNVLNGISGGLTAIELSYSDGVTDYIQDQIDSLWTEVNDTLKGSTVYRQLLDTTLYFAPAIGVGNAGDTIAFTLNNVIWGAKWGGSHSLVITKVTAVVAGTSPDIDLALLYDANYKDGTPTEVFSSDLTVTSTTTGNDATISANDTIDPGEWLWLRVDQATAKPTQCIINIYGHLE